MIVYTINDLTARIRDALQSVFTEEQFLNGELEGVVYGLVNSIRWTALRAAREQAINESQMVEGAEGKVILNNPIETLETVNRFSSKWMDRDEIVQRIENTSGLTTEMAEIGLRMIENVVDQVIVIDRSEINIIPLGRLRATESPAQTIRMGETGSTGGEAYKTRLLESVVYIIVLAEGLSIKSSGSSKTQSAAGGAAAASASW